MRLRNADCALFCARRLKDSQLIDKAEYQLKKIKRAYARWKIDNKEQSD
jgi:hypothetical protein